MLPRPRRKPIEESRLKGAPAQPIGAPDPGMVGVALANAARYEPIVRIAMSIHHELDENAGAPGATLRLAEALRTLGHEVEVIGFDHLDGPASTKRYRFPFALPRLIASRGRFDVADLSSGDGWLFSLLQNRRRRGTGAGDRPLIVARSHGLEHTLDGVLRRQSRAGGPHLSWKYPIYNGGYRLWECARSFRTADLALFLNQPDLDFAIGKLGVDAARARLCRNGVAGIFLDRAQHLAQHPAPERAQNVAFIGSFIPRKGIVVLADAINAVLAKHPHARLGLFGTGAGADTIYPHFSADLHARISILPRFDNAALPDLLADYHLLAFPSLSEGGALTPVEAMCCGLVPLVSAAPGAHENVEHGQSGLVLPTGDAAALAAAIGELFDDPQRWRAMRQAALAAGQSHGWPVIARETLHLYEKFATQTAKAGVLS